MLFLCKIQFCISLFTQCNNASVIWTNGRKLCEYYTASWPNKIQRYTDDLRHYATTYATNEQAVTVIVSLPGSTPMELHEYATYVILLLIAVAVMAASFVS